MSLRQLPNGDLRDVIDYNFNFRCRYKKSTDLVETQINLLDLLHENTKVPCPLLINNKGVLINSPNATQFDMTEFNVVMKFTTDNYSFLTNSGNHFLLKWGTKIKAKVAFFPIPNIAASPSHLMQKFTLDKLMDVHPLQLLELNLILNGLPFDAELDIITNLTGLIYLPVC